MSASEKIPKAMAEIYSAITALTDAFSGKYLNEEYSVMIRRVIGALARKRPSPLARGKGNVWAAAAVHAVGQVNFLVVSSYGVVVWGQTRKTADNLRALRV